MGQNLFSTVGLPTVVNLDPRLSDFLGPLATLVVTLLNGAAFLIAILLVVRISIILFTAVVGFRDPKKALGEQGFTDEADLLKGSAMSTVEAFLIAAVAYMVVANGFNLLYFFSVNIASSLIVDQQKDYLPSVAGPFAGLVAMGQTFVSLAIIVAGGFILITKWWGALSKATLKKSGQSTFEALNETIRSTAMLTIAVVAGFVVVRYGPNIFYDLLNNAGNSIVNPNIVDPLK